MRTLWLLQELAVPFEVVVYPFDAALRAPAFLDKSPAGRVPALDLDGRVLFETGAIAQILCERFDPDGLGRPAGHAEWADWLVWLHFAETMSAHAANLTQQHIMLYEDTMRSPVVMKLEARRLEKTYDAVEARLAHRDWILDGGFSAADIAVGQTVYMAQHFAHIGERPAMARWWAAIADRPAFLTSLPPAGEGLYARDFYAPWDSAS